MGDKTKATFRIEKDKWDEFVNLCQDNNTTATAELTKVIEFALANGEISFDEREKLPKCLKTFRDSLKYELEAGIQRQFAMLKMMTPTNEVGTKDSTDSRTDTEATGQECTDEEVDNCTVLEESASVEIKKQNQKKKQPDNTWTDREVSEEENLSPETIRRYRTKQRTPQDPEFWNRWKVTAGGKRWLKNN